MDFLKIIGNQMKYIGNNWKALEYSWNQIQQHQQREPPQATGTTGGGGGGTPGHNMLLKPNILEALVAYFGPGFICYQNLSFRMLSLQIWVRGAPGPNKISTDFNGFDLYFLWLSLILYRFLKIFIDFD